MPWIIHVTAHKSAWRRLARKNNDDEVLPATNLNWCSNERRTSFSLGVGLGGRFRNLWTTRKKLAIYLHEIFNFIIHTSLKHTSLIKTYRAGCCFPSKYSVIVQVRIFKAGLSGAWSWVKKAHSRMFDDHSFQFSSAHLSWKKKSSFVLAKWNK